MTKHETYVTKADPSDEDWLAFNKDFFNALKGQEPENKPQYAPLTDADRHAAKAGVSVEEYFGQLNDRVGPLGEAALRLVYSEMDGAWHITVALKEETQSL